MRLKGATEAVQKVEYPITSEEFSDECSEQTLELQNGTETVPAVLDRLGNETYERPEDALYALYTGVSDKAIGRKGYSDRDPTIPGGIDGHEQLSF